MYKYLQLKDQLIKEINLLDAHQKLPSRPYLCRKHNISRATVDKVFKELEKEGLVYAKKGSGTYVSQLGAQNITTINGKIKSWAVIIPNIMYDIYPGLIRGIEDYANQYDINIILCNTDNDAKKEYEYITRLVNSEILGIIIIPAISSNVNVDWYQYLKSHNIPFVFCNRGFDALVDVPLVASNDFYGGYIATKHLLKKGYSRISFLSKTRYTTSMNRFFGYEAALLEAGIEIDRKLIATEINDYDDGGLERSVSKILYLEQPADAFFCHNDNLASDVYKILIDRDFKISDEVGLIGYDNSNLCERLNTRLTSISYQNYEIGYKAANILYKLTLGQKLEGSNVYIFQPKLEERDSCKGPNLIAE